MICEHIREKIELYNCHVLDRVHYSSYRDVQDKTTLDLRDQIWLKTPRLTFISVAVYDYMLSKLNEPIS